MMCGEIIGVGPRIHVYFLGAFAKLLKATIIFVVSVRMEQLGSHWPDFNEISYLRNLQKPVEKMQVRLKLKRITSTLDGDLCTCVLMQ
jgi:hypothetical protein